MSRRYRYGRLEPDPTRPLRLALRRAEEAERAAGSARTAAGRTTALRKAKAAASAYRRLVRRKLGPGYSVRAYDDAMAAVTEA